MTYLHTTTNTPSHTPILLTLVFTMVVKPASSKPYNLVKSDLCLPPMS